MRDTPAQILGFSFHRHHDHSMTMRRRGQGGRPSKGERRLVVTRLPTAQADRVRDVADRQGVTVSDWLAQVIAERLADERVTTRCSQEALLDSA